MISDAAYEFCCDLLLDQQDARKTYVSAVCLCLWYVYRRLIDGAQMQHLASLFVDECIRVNNKICLLAATKIVDAYHMGKEAKSEVKILP